jgi:hypothetical protein
MATVKFREQMRRPGVQPVAAWMERKGIQLELLRWSCYFTACTRLYFHGILTMAI